MNRPRDDEYGSLRDLLGDPYDDGTADDAVDDVGDDAGDDTRDDAGDDAGHDTASPGDTDADDAGADAAVADGHAVADAGASVEPSVSAGGDPADEAADAGDPADATADDVADLADEAADAGDPAGATADDAGDPADEAADAGDPADDLTDSDMWGGLPPDLQAEYAEAYRRGYERARLADEPTQQLDLSPLPTPPSTPPQQRPAPRSSSTPPPTPPSTPPQQRPAPRSSSTPPAAFAPHPVAQPVPQSVAQPVAQPGKEQRPAPDWLQDRRVVVAGLVALALLVVGAAFGVGRLFAEDPAGPSAGEDVDASRGGKPREGRSAYRGPVKAATIADARATCQTGSSVDAAGNPVTYEPAKAYDANVSTAWRCDGSGAGQRFTISLPRKTVVAEVGLVPGYAKTDPASGVDRYAENNRITKVRWRFDDGTSFVQRMSGDAADRRLRTIRVPETSTRQVVLEILESQPGPRNTVAISELRIASPS